MYIELDSSCHGGDCCGIRHIYGFENYEYSEYGDGDLYDATIDKMHNVVKFDFLRESQGILIEAVLTSEQPLWQHQMLVDIGFETVNWFINNNSSNKCIVYHFAQDPARRKLKFPRTQDKALKDKNRVVLRHSDIS